MLQVTVESRSPLNWWMDHRPVDPYDQKVVCSSHMIKTSTTIPSVPGH